MFTAAGGDGGSFATQEVRGTTNDSALRPLPGSLQSALFKTSVSEMASWWAWGLRGGRMGRRSSPTLASLPGSEKAQGPAVLSALDPAFRRTLVRSGPYKKHSNMGHKPQPWRLDADARRAGIAGWGDALAAVWTCCDGVVVALWTQRGLRAPEREPRCRPRRGPAPSH